MPGSFTDSLEKAVLDYVLNIASYTPPTTRYIALFTVMPSEDGTGGTEVSGGNYSRVPEPTWKEEAPGQRSNEDVITFPQADADWGTVVGFGLFDADTSGNLMMFGTLTSSKDILNGDQPSFPVGALLITLD